MSFPESTLEQANETEIDYKKFLKIKRVDMNPDLKKAILKFSLAKNYNIFVTSQSHEHLYFAHDVNPEETLTEGYIFFDENTAIEKIDFKIDSYQTIPAFDGTPYQLAQLKKAVTDMLKESFEKK